MSYYEQDNQDPYYDNRFNRDPAVMPHSGLGVASFIIAMIVVVLSILAVVLIVMALGQAYSRSGGRSLATAGGLIICGGAVAALVGVGLGIGACFQENRNRTFAIVGLILNGLIILAVAVLFAIGMMADARWMR